MTTKVNIRVHCALFLLALDCFAAHSAWADVRSAVVRPISCEGMGELDLSTLEDAATEISSSKALDPGKGMPGYCQVEGTIRPSTSFIIRMPRSGWNGHFLQLGCGGQCGTTEHVKECDSMLMRGYACIAADRGHKYVPGSGRLDWTNHTNLESNLQAVMEWTIRSTHVTALAGKAIVRHFYGKSPDKSFFMGGSAGGHAAMLEAQNFPWDFDGILAMVPAIRATKTSWLWNARWFNGAEGKPLFARDDLSLLHDAVVAQCDMNDGLRDGFIGDPRRCSFKPQKLLCIGSGTEGCLTEKQVEAVNKIYDGPITSNGTQIEPPSAMRGSELLWMEWFTGSAPDYFMDVFRFLVLQADPGRQWTYADFDFDLDYKRLGLAGSFINANNPDLRSFKAAGGKLLLVTGWDDGVEGALDTIDYYETVERLMGGRDKTQNFLRLFVGPAIGHCACVEAGFSVDYLSVLESWVVQGTAPDRLIAHYLPLDLLRSNVFGVAPLDPKSVILSRPLFPYPIQTHYLGHGDTKSANSFGPREF